jgi:hypothetical protein
VLDLRPNCECCNKDLPPAATNAMIFSFECPFCRDLRGEDGGWALPELRRRTGGASHPPGREAGTVSGIHRAGHQSGRLRRSLILIAPVIEGTRATKDSSCRGKTGRC